MTDYIFKENEFTEAFDFSYEPYLFHYSSHLAIQYPDWITFSVVSKKRGKVEGHLHVAIKNKEGISPVRAPFGSFQFSPSLKPLVLFKFIEFVCERLKKKGIESLTIKNAPDFFEPESSPVLNTFLLNQGFLIINSEVQTVVRTGDDFSSGLSAWEKRRLRQAKEAGLIFKRLDSKQLKSVYQFILDCRVERDYILSIDWSTLKRTVDAFPDRFILFGVMHKDEFAAASISINAGNKILSNFHSAHPRKFDRLSPVVMLLKGIFDFCCENDFRLLDLGTSSLEGLPNFKLLNFKLGLGAHPTMKLTFKKLL